MVYTSLVPTPHGAMVIGVDDAGTVVQVSLPNRVREHPQRQAFSDVAQRGIQHATQQLAEYFAGARREFDLAIDPQGTEFELDVWRRLREIPYGATTSYGAIAQELGLINGARAHAIA